MKEEKKKLEQETLKRQFKHPPRDTGHSEFVANE